MTPSTPLRLPARSVCEDYDLDRHDMPRTLLGILAAGLGAVILTLLAWKVLKTTSLPAFANSEQTKALATAGAVIIVAVASGCAVLGHKRRTRPYTLFCHAVLYLSPAALVITTLGIPLSATRLYLDGINVDQGFRTQFLTWMGYTSHLSDMNYIDMPSYYPGAWFWIGGRLANLLGIPGWEVFQPWALISLATAGSILVPVWQRICGSLTVASGIALVTTSITIVMSADEPYAAIITMGVPAATVMMRRALTGSLWPLIGLTLYIGVSAAMYTLFTAVVALSVCVMAALFAVVFDHSIKPLLRLLIIGTGSALIASTVWAPYLTAILSGQPHSGATAMHYLPPTGAQVPMPMLQFNLVGLLCLLGLAYLIVRIADPDVRSMLIAQIVFYGWIVTSMIVSLSGKTLLGFRLDAIITIQLATAGMLALAELRLVEIPRFYPAVTRPATATTVTRVMVAILAIAGLSYAQQIPNRISHAIEMAYTDTDGYGERGDKNAPDSATYYATIDKTLKDWGYEPGETVVLTDEQNFMSYYPYRGFQAFTSHYANPLGEFDKRNDAVEHLASTSWTAPKNFNRSIDDLPWRAPDVFIFRGQTNDTSSTGWKYDLAEDIYPNNPNVRFRGIYFNPQAFQGWRTQQVGPFVVASKLPM